MPDLTLITVIKQRGINPYVHITADQAAQLKPAWRRPMPVLITVNNKPDTQWPINMMPVGDGSFYLYLHEIPRRASNTKVGDTVTVRIAFDENYQNGPQHEMPEWFAAALGKDSTARTNWEALPPSRKKEILRNFAGLKSAEAKERNLSKAMHVLAGNTGRFMARDWHDGR